MSSSKKKGLGKGLEAILGPARIQSQESVSAHDTQETVREQILFLNPRDVRPSKVQTRKTFNEDSIQQLAESIKRHGLQEPVIVRKSEGKYELVCGERRLRACILAGLTEIPAICRNVSDDESILLGLIENIQREDLNPIEEAEAYKSILESFQWSHEQLSETVGKDRSTISNSLRLLSLPSTIQSMIMDGTITTGHARSLVGLPSPELILQTARQIVEQGLSVRETEKLVSKLKEGTKKKSITPQKIKNPQLNEIEQQLCRKLGTKVSIKHSHSGKGKIEVSYFSNDELSRLLKVLGISFE